MFSQLMQLRSYFIALSLVMLSLVLANPAHAGTTNFTGTVDGSDPVRACNSSYSDSMEVHSFSVTVDGTYHISFDSISFTGVTNPSALFYALVSTTPTYTNAIAYAFLSDDGAIGESAVSLNAGQTYYLRFSGCGEMSAGYYTSASYNLRFEGVGDIISPAVANGDEQVNIVMPPDNRINWQFGDASTVIFPHDDGVAVYCYNGNTWLAMAINQEIVDNWDTSQPQETPVLEVNHAGCHVAFYILDDGQYQINIWTFEGKLYEIIADNIHFENAEMRYSDPNE